MSWMASAVAFCLAGAAAGAERVEVKVDPRLELAAAIASQSGQPYLTTADSPYLRAMRRWFAPWREHRAVAMLPLVWGRNASLAGGAMVCFSDPPALEPLGPLHECPSQPWGGADLLGRWMVQVRDFARVSNFDRFFKGCRPAYRSIVEQVRESLGEGEIERLEGYFGARQRRYTIALSPLASGNYGPHGPLPEGPSDAYAVLAGPSYGRPDYLRVLVRHEFSHSFTTLAVRRNRDLYLPYAALFEPIAAEVKRQGYGNWENCVAEHVVRAVVARLARLAEGPREAAAILRHEKSRGFRYIEPLYERLEEFETGPGRGRTFLEFAPRLLGVFREIAEGAPGR